LVTINLLQLKTIVLQKLRTSYGKGILWLAASRIFWIVNTLTVGILVTRHLGPEKFGMLNYAISFSTLFFMIISGSGDPLISQEIIKSPRRTGEILGNIALLHGILFTLFFSVETVFLYFSVLSSSQKYLCLIISLAYSSYIFQVIHPYFQATLQVKKNGICFLLAFVLYALLRLLALQFDFSLGFYAWIEAFLHISTNLFLLAAYIFSGGKLREWKISFKTILPVLKPFILLSCGGLVSVIYSRTDIMMLEYFSGAEAVGFYSLAVKISDSFLVFGTIILTTLFPAIIRGYEKSPSNGDRYLQKLTFSLFYLMLITAAAAAFAAEPVTRWLFGEKFAPSAGILQIYVFSLPTLILLCIYHNIAIYRKKISHYILTVITGCVLNFLGNLWLIPCSGVRGAALSSVFCMPLGILLTMPCFIQSRALLMMFLRSLSHLPFCKAER